MAVTLPADVLARYARATLYNSPYPAHDHGSAIDLYPTDVPGSAQDDGDGAAPSPVAGEVLDARSVRAPDRPYAEDRDHLLLVDVTAPPSAAGTVARVMHVEPSVATGDRVAVGDDLGRLVRSGYYAPWVANHLHVGFRDPAADPYRASGSLPLALGVDPKPVPWDGTGTVVATGDTYAVLDAPAHPAPGEWAGIAATLAVGGSRGAVPVALDGGLPHYPGGGLPGLDAGRPDGSPAAEGAGRPVSLLGTVVGHATGRTVRWADVTVLADGTLVHGLSLSLAREAGFGAKLVCPDAGFAVGDEVAVSISPG